MTVESFFGLRQEAFSIAPDPHFLYLSRQHSEALALLNLGLTRGASFVLLTGEIGAGKTTVWRHFLEHLPPNVDVASVVNPRLDVASLLARVCEDLNVELPPEGRPVDLIDALHGHLLLSQAMGRRTLIVIDEAQALSDDVLEQLRLLTNLDSSGKKLQVMLIAQPEMRQILERPEMEPLAQRIVARFHLPALSPAETASYVAHRLRVAGLAGALPFDGSTLMLVHDLCRGVPRRINVLCDHALALAEAEGEPRIGPELLARAAEAAFGTGPVAPPPALAPPSEPVPLAPAAAAGRPAPVVVVPRGAALALVGLAAVVAGSWLAPRFSGGGAPAPAVPVALAPVVAPPVAPPPPAPLASLDRVFDLPMPDEPASLSALAALWGAPPAAGDPCAAPGATLQCYRSNGGLAALRPLDRPALLLLADARGRRVPVLLLGLRDDLAVLALGGAEQAVPLAELSRWWRGDFVTFWRAPPGWRADDPAAAAEGLVQLLARADGQPAAPGSAATVLRTRVFSFQLAQGLTPDGVAGPLTVMQLNRVAGVDEPRLGATSGSRPS